MHTGHKISYTNNPTIPAHAAYQCLHVVQEGDDVAYRGMTAPTPTMLERCPLLARPPLSRCAIASLCLTAPPGCIAGGAGSVGRHCFGTEEHLKQSLSYCKCLKHR